MSPYSYRRLLEGADYIRLLWLMPLEIESIERTEVQCKLFDYPLQDTRKGTHQYEALSYTWGGKEKPCSILIDEKDFGVTTNLYAALLRLRHRSLARILWVDAICINQEHSEEQAQQVRLMAMIYSKAYCVLVWLGETTDNVDGALEDIQRVAYEQSTEGLDEKVNEKAIFHLLQRQWFQRIWVREKTFYLNSKTTLTQFFQVLQEVAAARNVVIQCGLTEIDGYAFCQGLKSLRTSQRLSYKASPRLQSLPSLTHLIEQAGLRPKYTSSSQETYSLKISSLAQLVDIFHTREASDPRDRVYALLGMSSDDPIKAGLQPDYTILWEELFERLVRFILGTAVFVKAIGAKAVIKSKGCILGQVSAVGTNNGQSVQITSTNTAWTSRNWSLQVSAKSVLKGDVVCLLKGALKPVIIRLCGDHYAVVVISASPENQSGSFGLPEVLKSRLNFSRDLLLAWDWDFPPDNSRDQKSIGTWRKNIQVHQDLKAELGDHLDKAISIWNVALVLGDLKEYGKAEEKLREAIKCYEIANRKETKYLPKGQYGLTPLSWVAGNGYDLAVKMLLTKDGLDPDLQDSQYSRTPLSWAAEGGHEIVVKLLLQTGKVKVSTKDSLGRTPLLEAAYGGHEAIVKLLLETGEVKVDSRDNNGRTPLLEAATRGHLDVVERLLQDKADVNATAAFDGRTALQAAAGGGHLAIENLLRNAGAM